MAAGFERALTDHALDWRTLRLPLTTMGASMGANVRVGLEDSLWIGPGELATSSAAQVTKVRHVLEGLSLDVATPDEARHMLALKGRDAVAF